MRAVGETRRLAIVGFAVDGGGGGSRGILFSLAFATADGITVAVRGLLGAR